MEAVSWIDETGAFETNCVIWSRSVMVWGCMGANGVGNLILIDGTTPVKNYGLAPTGRHRKMEAVFR